MARRRVVVVLADGVRADVLAELLADGALPAIARSFPDAAMRRTAVSTFPSTTGPAFLPLLTGCFPGTANVPGIRWFDRTVWADRERRARNPLPAFRSYVGIESWRINADLDARRRTLFELLPRSVNIFSLVNRGVPWKTDLTAFSRLLWWLFAHETSRWDLVAARGRQHLVAALQLDPDFVFCLAPDIDEYSHLTTVRSARTIAAYRRLDRLVAQLFGALDRRRWRDDTLVVLVSDHGLSDVHTHLGLPEWVAARGMRPLYYPRIWRRRFDSAVMVSGNGMAHVYLRGENGWTPERTNDAAVVRGHGGLVADLLRRPEIALTVTQRGDGAVVARAAHGDATIRRAADGQVEYRPNGIDPFGYPDLGGCWQPDDLLAATMGTRYPDAPVQLLQLFDSRRTGDIVVCAEEGYDLRDRHEHPEHRAGHGSLHAGHLLVPWFSTAPLPDTPLRTADVFPSVLRWLGCPIPAGTDGRNPWENAA